VLQEFSGSGVDRNRGLRNDISMENNAS